MTPLIDLFLRRHRLSLLFIVIVVCCRNCLSPLSFNVAKWLLRCSLYVLLLLFVVVIVCLCNWPLLLSLVSSISFACSLFLRSFARLLVRSFVYSYLIHPFALVCSIARSLLRLFARSLVCSFASLLVRSFACSSSFACSLVRLFVRSLVCLFPRLLLRLFACSLVCSFARSLVPSFTCSSFASLLVHLFVY